jgi:hypothetical protein
MNGIPFRLFVGCAAAAFCAMLLCGCPPPPTGPEVVVVNSVEALNAALAGLSTQGGRIVVKAGTYTLENSVVIAKNNVVVEGEGAATHFRLANDANEPCFVIGEPTPEQPTAIHRNIALKNLLIDGNRLNQASELSDTPGRAHLRNNCVTVRACEGVTLENLVLQNARSGGVVTEKGCDDVVMDRVTAFGNEFDGIACYVTTGSLITGCTCRDNEAAGLSCDLGFDGNVVTECFFGDNGTVGVFWRDCADNILADCVMSENEQDGIFLADGDAPGNLPTTRNLFQGNLYLDNGRHGIWQAGANSVDNVLDGGIFEGNVSSAINESFAETAPLIRYDVTLID